MKPSEVLSKAARILATGRASTAAAAINAVPPDRPTWKAHWDAQATIKRMGTPARFLREDSSWTPTDEQRQLQVLTLLFAALFAADEEADAESFFVQNVDESMRERARILLPWLQ